MKIHRECSLLVTALGMLVAGCSPSAEQGGLPEDTSAALGGTAPAPSASSRGADTSGEAALPAGVPQSYEADMAALAQGMGLQDPPAVTPERAVSNLERPIVMTECLTAKGFPTEVSADGRGWESGFSRDQAEAYAVAEYTCMGTYPMAAVYLQPYDDDQLLVHYDWMREEVIPCMRDLGYPTPEVPSWESVRADYAQGRALWFPDTELDPATVADDMAVIMDSCEIYPPNELIYGEG